MPVGERRNRTLYGLLAKRHGMHRYTVLRWAIGVVSTIGVALLPLTDTLRIDLWDGRHHWLGEQVGLVEALKAFAFPFLAINVLIVLASRFVGRYLCGFVCPIGNLNRFAEFFRWTWRKGKRRPLGTLILWLACALLIAITFSFWVDWDVFSEGSTTAVALSWTFLVGGTVGLVALVSGLGMRFCRELCPSGVYFAVLGPESQTGIEFAHPENCTDCYACENACPVDLKPREMASEDVRAGMGFYPEGLSNFANCLRCGDCVAVCESTTSPVGTPLRLGWLANGVDGETGDEPERES